METIRNDVVLAVRGVLPWAMPVRVTPWGEPPRTTPAEVQPHA